MLIDFRETADQGTVRYSAWFTARTARDMAHAGLTLRGPAELDRAVANTLRHRHELDLSAADAAVLAVAIIHGYAATHPVADHAERAYVARLERRKVLRAGTRRLRAAAWRFIGNVKSPGFASGAFAHLYAQGVDNAIRAAARADKVDAMTQTLAALQVGPGNPFRPHRNNPSDVEPAL